MPATTSHSPASALTRNVRRRLLLLLIQALAVGVACSTTLFFGLIVMLFAGSLATNSVQGQPFWTPITVEPFRYYYLGRGSWEGIEQHFTVDQPPLLLGDSDLDPFWDELLLADASERVILAHNPDDASRVGQPLVLEDDEVLIPIEVDGQTVGYLASQQPDATRIPNFSLVSSLAGPLIFFTITGMVFVVIIGVLLVRRFINPMSEVIAATTLVAAGDLSTRVNVHGTGDIQGLITGFNHMADALESNTRQRRNMLADIAHELRTPLTVIRARLEGIVDGVYPSNEAHIAPVLAETYLLERLVDDLRLLTMAETRALKLDFVAVDSSELLTHAVDLFRPEAEEAGIALQLELPAGLPLLWADPQRLGQVAGNLISNALRYCNAGDTVRVSAEPLDSRLRIRISDSGPGVDPGEIGLIFERFWRAEKSRSRATGGAGLGLAIARQLVAAHGGEIGAEVAGLGGLAVWFTVPLAEVD